jgi:hypothetical protein
MWNRPFKPFDPQALDPDRLDEARQLRKVCRALHEAEREIQVQADDAVSDGSKETSNEILGHLDRAFSELGRAFAACFPHRGNGPAKAEEILLEPYDPVDDGEGFADSKLAPGDESPGY